MCMHASQYALYQHFLHTPDQQVEALLRLFTTVPCSDIDGAIAAHETQPDRRAAQRLLARQVTTDVRGESSCRSAEQVRLARLGVAAAVHALTPRVTRRLARCCLVALPPICGRVTCWKWLKRYGPTRLPRCRASLPSLTQVCAGTRHSDDSGRLRRRQRRGHCPWRWPGCFQRCVHAACHILALVCVRRAQYSRHAVFACSSGGKTADQGGWPVLEQRTSGERGQATVAGRPHRWHRLPVAQRQA